MKVLVFIEQRAGKIKSSSLEALSTAAAMSGNKPDDVAGILIGQNIEGQTDALKGYGAGKVYIADHSDFADYNSLSYAKAVTKAAEDFKPDALLGVATPMGRDLFPRLSARLDAGLLTDLVDVDTDAFSGGLKPMYAGKVLARVSFQGSGLKMATLRPNVFPAKESGGDATPVGHQVESPGD